MFPFKRQRILSRFRRAEAAPSFRYPGLPAIFDRFGPAPRNDDPVFSISFLGDRVRKAYDEFSPDPVPRVDEELFEWMDVLESAEAARGVFTVLELGACYGRWGVRSVLAARRIGKSAKIGFAEAAPKHVEWLKTTLEDNGVRPFEYRICNAAIDDAPGDAAFVVGMPSHASDVTSWYGQASVPDYKAIDCPTIGTYYGTPLHEAGGGWKFIMVPQVPMSALLDDYAQIDLVDMDLQGTEARAVAEAIAPLTAKVRKLHIGTHSADIEDSLRDTLNNAGWICIRDYPCGQQNDTPFGRCTFVDGVQTWMNPRRF